MTITSAPVVRTTPPPAQPVSDEQRTRNLWPSYCAVCRTDTQWFPTQKDRREWETLHQHGGAD